MELYIREIRKNKKMSLNELSINANVSKSFLSDLENGVATNVSIIKLCSIAEALDVEVTELFSCGKEDKNDKSANSSRNGKRTKNREK